jgi:hypothetical protein
MKTCIVCREYITAGDRFRRIENRYVHEKCFDNFKILFNAVLNERRKWSYEKVYE